jgi:hypothetical protein
VSAMFDIGFNVAVACAFARAAVVLAGGARSLAQRRRFAVVRFGAPEALTVPEPFALAATAAVLLANRESSASVPAGDAIAALAGGLISLAGVAVCVWTLLSWRQLFVGHALLPGQASAIAIATTTGASRCSCRDRA